MTTMQIPNTMLDASNSQRQHRLTSTSEDEDDTYNNNNSEWQVIQRTKRGGGEIHRTPLNTPDTMTETQNRYGLLSKIANQKTQMEIQDHHKFINLHSASSTESSNTEK
jgi:hypothetical protein